MISIKRTMRIAKRRLLRCCSTAVKVQEQGEVTEKNFEEEYKQFLSSIPDYSDEAYQNFMVKAHEAKNLDLTKNFENYENLAVDSKERERVETLFNCIINLTESEMTYFNEILEELMLENEGVHPLIYNLDLEADVPKEGEEFVHPVNFFLQQMAMQELWREREGMSFGGGGGASAGGEAVEEAVEEVEEQTAFDVILIKTDDKKKIKAIKEAKNILGLGLKEAKELMTQEGAQLANGVSKEEAEEMKEKFEAVGCEIEIK